MTAEEIISSISEEWFLSEPLMFDLLCTHKLEANPELSVMFRTGRGKIEYNPDLIDRKPKAKKMLSAEIYRILLKHPYERVPPSPNHVALKKASDITIRENCDYYDESELISAKHYNLKSGQSYEDYYNSLKHICPDYQSGRGAGKADNFEPDKGQGKKSDKESAGPDKVQGKEVDSQKKDFEATELWEEDTLMSERIQGELQKAKERNQYGSISGDLVERILTEKRVPLDYKRILSHFRTSMLSNLRTLTRFRPNRRYGFDYMGSRYKETYRLLVAVDSSGSIMHEDLEKFFSIINRFFKYGAKEIKVIVFDTEIKQEMTFKKARTSLEVKGRGGTDFQVAIDYYERSAEYDGLIIFTDGYASHPRRINKKRILWILNDKKNYEQNSNWIKKIQGCDATWIS